jgi:tetratricopeptide (TPR) repeat protein
VAASLAVGAVVSTVFAVAEARERDRAEQAALAEKAAREQADAAAEAERLARGKADDARKAEEAARAEAERLAEAERVARGKAEDAKKAEEAARVRAEQLAVAERAAKERAEQRERDVQAVLGQQVRLTSEFGGGDTGTRMAAELMRQVDALAATIADPARRAALQEAFKEGLRSINMTDVASSLVTEIMLDRAIARADREHAADPFVRAGLLMSAGRAYQQLGRLDRAGELFRRAKDLYAPLLGADDRRTLTAEQWMARVDRDRASGEAQLRAVLARWVASVGAEDVDAVECRRLLGALLEEKGDLAGALAEYRACAAVKALPTEVRLGTMSAIGDLQRRQGELDAAIATLSAVRAEVEALKPIPERLHVNVLTNLGLCLADPNLPDRQAEGLSLLRRAIAIDSSFYGDAHPLSFDSRGNLAATLLQLDDGSGAALGDAVKVLEESRRIGSGLVSPPDEYLLALMEAAVLMAETAPQDPAASAPVLADAVKLGEDSIRLVESRRIADAARWRDVRKNMAYLYGLVGRHADAERLQRQVRDLWVAAGEPSAIPVFNITADLAGTLVAQERVAEAIDLLQAMQDAKPARAETSDARWLNAVTLRNLLREQAGRDDGGAAKPRLTRQEAEVAMLRKAREQARLAIDLDAPAEVVPVAPPAP